MARRVFAFFALGLVLTACSKEPKVVGYYAQHEAERQELLKKAQDNPVKYKGNPDVINAATARVNELNNKLHFH